MSIPKESLAKRANALQTHEPRPVMDSDNTTMDALATACEVAKSISEVFNQVPYIGAIAKVVLNIITIKDEMKSNKDRCTELIERVCLDFCPISKRLQTIAEAGHPERHDELKGDLEWYQRLLESMYTVLSTWSARGFRGTVRRIVQRGDFQDVIDKYVRKMDSFHLRFSTSCLSALRFIADSDHRNASTSAPVVAQALPPDPTIIVGRDTEIKKIIDDLEKQDNTPTRAVILGLGGIGKSTIARSVLHNERVKLRYNTARYFISCEPTPTSDLLLNAIAVALCMSGQGQSQLLSRIVDRLSTLKPALICFDNFETVWEHPGHRAAVDEILSCLAGVNTLDIVVTMRGIESPVAYAIRWLRIVPSTLEHDDAWEIYQRIVELDLDESDKRLVHEILKELAGIPLAITLMSHLIRDGIESPQSLSRRWKAIHVDALKNSSGGDHRLLSVTASIKLSVESHRMDDESRHLLRTLSFLPDGLRVDFEFAILGIPNLETHLRTLVRVSLMSKSTDPGTSIARYTMLPPIRRYSQQHLTSPSELLTKLTAFFADLIVKHEDFTKPEDQAVVVPELRNIRSLLIATMSEDTPFTEAAIHYTQWSTYTYPGACDEEVVQQALQFAGPSPKAACYLELGYAQRWNNNYEAAKFSYTQSRLLSQLAKDNVGQARALQRMGEEHFYEGNIEDAEVAFLEALALNHEQDVVYLARTHEFIGRVHMDREVFKEAEASFNTALALYKRVGHVLGQGNTHVDIGRLKTTQGELEVAELSLLAALPLYKKIQSGVGQANVHKFMGLLQMKRGDLDDAQKSFMTALPLYEQIQRSADQADIHDEIGHLHMKWGNVDAARASFSTSLALYEQVKDVKGQSHARGNLRCVLQAMAPDSSDSDSDSESRS